MKHLQYFQKRKPASIDDSIDAPGSENKSQATQKGIIKR